MEPTSKDEALQLKRLHLEEDAVRYIRQLEAYIAVWEGLAVLRVDVPTRPLAEYIVSIYKPVGWDVRVNAPSSYGNNYVVQLS